MSVDVYVGLYFAGGLALGVRDSESTFDFLFLLFALSENLSLLSSSASADCEPEGTPGFALGASDFALSAA